MKVNPEDLITVGKAYAAMYEFLVRFQESFKSDDVAVLLTGLSTLTDGKPADDAYWEEWIESVEKAQNGEVDMRLISKK